MAIVTSTPVVINGQPVTASAPPAPAALNASQQSIYDLMTETLKSWGLASLAGTLKNLIIGGDTSTDTLALALSQTPQYKQRFAANAIREKNGLPDLSPADYIGLESQYRQVLSQYGLPKGFYDQHSDFTNWIAGDVSPSEVQARAQVASQQYVQAPQEIKDYWARLGFTPGTAVAAILDPNHESLATLQEQANAAAVGGSALQQGINVSTRRATQFADNGVTLDQARAAYQRIAAYGQTDSQIAKRFGTTFGQTAEENDLLLNSGAAAAKRERLYGEEAAQFAGRGGATTASGNPGANY